MEAAAECKLDINNFQKELNLAEEAELVKNNESFLTAMESEPSERSIKNILDFACSYEVVETENAGYVEVNLN